MTDRAHVRVPIVLQRYDPQTLRPPASMAEPMDESTALLALDKGKDKLMRRPAAYAAAVFRAPAIIQRHFMLSGIAIGLNMLCVMGLAVVGILVMTTGSNSDDGHESLFFAVFLMSLVLANAVWLMVLAHTWCHPDVTALLDWLRDVEWTTHLAAMITPPDAGDSPLYAF